METIKNKKVIFIGIALVVALFIFMNISGSSSAPVPIQTTTAAPSADDQAMIALLRRIQKITLDGSLFNDPAFRSLKDFSRAIRQEPQARDNPFLPPAQESVSATTTTGTGARTYQPVEYAAPSAQ